MQPDNIYADDITWPVQYVGLLGYREQTDNKLCISVVTSFDRTQRSSRQQHLAQLTSLTVCMNVNSVSASCVSRPHSHGVDRGIVECLLIDAVIKQLPRDHANGSRRSRSLETTTVTTSELYQVRAALHV
jgi:hypothetical protein